MPQIVTFKNGAKAIREHSGKLKIISGPLPKKKKGKGIHPARNIIGGPNTIPPPWVKMGISYDEWKSQEEKNRIKQLQSMIRIKESMKNKQ